MDLLVVNFVPAILSIVDLVTVFSNVSVVDVFEDLTNKEQKIVVPFVAIPFRIKTVAVLGTNLPSVVGITGTVVVCKEIGNVRQVETEVEVGERVKLVSVQITVLDGSKMSSSVC